MGKNKASTTAKAQATKPEPVVTAPVQTTVPLVTNDAPAGSGGLQADDLAPGASTDSTQADSPVIKPPVPPETAALPVVQYDVRPADPAKAAVVGGYYTPPPPIVRR